MRELELSSVELCEVEDAWEESGTPGQGFCGRGREREAAVLPRVVGIQGEERTDGVIEPCLVEFVFCVGLGIVSSKATL